jgi:thioredoxin reductase (NADPH)
VQRLKASGQDVAVVLAGLRKPEMSGVDFLVRVRDGFPLAKRLLLLDPMDMETRSLLPRAMALGRIDYFEFKPGVPPNERFHRVVTDLLEEWISPYHSEANALVRVVGEGWSRRSHGIKELLERYGVPHVFYPVDSREGRDVLKGSGHGDEQLPVVALPGGRVLVEPPDREIADAFVPANAHPSRQTVDVVVIGGGPAGLSAGVYGASEGLSTAIVEREAIGGQAGASSLIRNYLGFARGVSGQRLAYQAFQQATLFGANFRLMRPAKGLRRVADELVVTLSDGSEGAGRAVIVATGASYRRLDVPELEALSGAGVFYGAATTEARVLEGQEAYVVGGANSAGQAALHLSKYASRVTLLVRGGSLEASMSDYLVKEIGAKGNVEIRFNTRVVGGGGEGRLERVVLEDSVLEQKETVGASALFVLIDAEPRTEWLPGEILRDERGFVLTGQDLTLNGRPRPGWPLERPPMLLETSMPGVFAAGDVRHRSVKRVASAVGEGSIAIRLVHEFLN